MLLGKINRQGLTQGAFASWFNAEYSAYDVNTAALVSLQNKLKDIRVEAFIGTWCSDSQRELPRFYKIMDFLKMDEKALTVIAVDDHPDRRKTSPQGEEKGKNIEYVPTFIFFRNGVELGRIVESPQSSLEADMTAILSK